MACVDVIKFRTTLASSTTTSVPEQACAIKNRYEITLEGSELLCMNNCMSHALPDSQDYGIIYSIYNSRMEIYSSNMEISTRRHYDLVYVIRAILALYI